MENAEWNSVTDEQKFEFKVKEVTAWYAERGGLSEEDAAELATYITTLRSVLFD